MMDGGMNHGQAAVQGISLTLTMHADSLDLRAQARDFNSNVREKKIASDKRFGLSAPTPRATLSESFISL